jgi:hypothetical protein
MAGTLRVSPMADCCRHAQACVCWWNCHSKQEKTCSDFSCPLQVATWPPPPTEPPAVSPAWASARQHLAARSLCS